MGSLSKKTKARRDMRDARLTAKRQKDEQKKLAKKDKIVVVKQANLLVFYRFKHILVQKKHLKFSLRCFPTYL